GIVGVNFHVTRLVTRFLKEFVRYRVSIRHGFELSKKLVMPSTPILTHWAVDNSRRELRGPAIYHDSNLIANYIASINTLPENTVGNGKSNGHLPIVDHMFAHRLLRQPHVANGNSKRNADKIHPVRL
ncbi:MAG: hypothetical protein AAF939_04925, partial [Planctomycetota bacterium]